MTGRTTWWAKDAAWHRRELVVELGEEFGAEGPNVVDVLACWAQEQRAAGEVRGGFRILAREAFVTVSHAQSIVERAAEIGALKDLTIDEDGRRFTCRVAGFRADQDRGRAAWRQAEKRSRAGENDPGQAVTDRDAQGTDRDESRRVTKRPPPDQTKPEKNNPPTPQGGIRVPTRPSGKRTRELEAFQQQVRDYAASEFPNLDDTQIGFVGAAIAQGATDHEAVQAFVARWVEQPTEPMAATTGEAA